MELVQGLEKADPEAEEPGGFQGCLWFGLGEKKASVFLLKIAFCCLLDSPPDTPTPLLSPETCFPQQDVVEVTVPALTLDLRGLRCFCSFRPLSAALVSLPGLTCCCDRHEPSCRDRFRPDSPSHLSGNQHPSAEQPSQPTGLGEMITVLSS